jgi:ribosome maturation factor RimP
MDPDVRLEGIVSRELEELGYELVKIEMPVRGRRRIVRLFIDRPERGVTIDDCVRVSRAIGFVLDGEGIVPGPYNLEVSSPGINRSLTKPAHFKRFAGHTVRIEHTAGSGGKETLIGSIVDAGDEAVTLETGQGARRVEFGAILKANLHGERWEISKGARARKRSRTP